MKYEVKFSCGHVHIVELTGKREERERKIKYYEEKGLCPECKDNFENNLNSLGCEEVRMSYREYKADYSYYAAKKGSYDESDKTIIVYVPVSDNEEETTNDESEVLNTVESTSVTEENLPQLSGSEKQIAYANDIRNASLLIAEKFSLADLIEKMQNEDSSLYFIENENLKSTLNMSKKSEVEILDCHKRIISENIDIIRKKMEGAKRIEIRSAIKPYIDLYDKLEKEFLEERGKSS